MLSVKLMGFWGFRAKSHISHDKTKKTEYAARSAGFRIVQPRTEISLAFKKSLLPANDSEACAMNSGHGEYG